MPNSLHHEQELIRRSFKNQRTPPKESYIFIRVPISHVPPLREHLEDIPLIAGRFCEVVRRQLGVGAVRFRPDTFSAMQSYAWPGNVRELENVIARAVLRASAERPDEGLVVVAPQHLGIDLSLPAGSDQPKTKAGGQAAPSKPLRAALEDFQRDLILSAVEESDGNWAAAARQLGVNRSNLHKLAKRLGVKWMPAASSAVIEKEA